MNLNADRAAMALAQGKPGTCGILKKADGSFEFLGFGLRRPVQALRLSVKGEVLTEKACPFNLIMRRGKPGREAWAVLTDQEWNTLLVSNNTDTPLYCVALIEPELDQSQQFENSDTPPIPLAIRARFDSTYSGLLVIRNDYDFYNLLNAEIASMIPKYDEQKKLLERNDSYGTESKRAETVGEPQRWITF